MSVQLHFVIRVPKPGPAIPLSVVDLHVQSFSIEALRANDGAIHCGGYDLDIATNPGGVLEAGDRENHPPKKGYYNLKHEYIDADNNNEGVVVRYYPPMTL